MKSKCVVVLLAILIQMRGMDLQGTHNDRKEVRKVIIGDHFYCECNYTDFNLRLNETNDKDEINIGRAYNGSIKLSFYIYEFDSNLVLDCKFKRITIVKIDEKTSNSKGLIPKEYYYIAGNTVNFECKPTRNPPTETKKYDSLHWFLIKDANMAKPSSQYFFDRKPTLNYSRKFTKEDDGSKLICFYFKCDEVNNIITCTRDVQKYILLKSTNDTSIVGFKTDLYKEFKVPPVFIYAIAGVAVMVFILVAAVVLYCRRKAPIKDTVEYCEIDLSSLSQTPIPVKKDEIIYSKVKGVLLPTQNTISNPPLSQQLRGSEMKAPPIVL